MRYRNASLLICIAGTILFGGAARHAATASETNSFGGGQGRTWYGVFGSGGDSIRLWSTKEYSGYQPVRAGAFVEKEAGAWLPRPSLWTWSMRYELEVERLAGTIELVEHQVPAEDRDGGPYMRTLDGLWQLAGICVPRVVFFPDSPVRPSLHAGLGLSWMNEKVIKNGTYYNYNIVGGAGIEADISRQWSLFADCRLEHYSNGGCMYLTDRVAIGLESINCVVGVRREF